MLTDLVEQAQLRTRRRSEGIFSAASPLIRKAVQGLGVITASFVLTTAQFPKGTDPTEVSPEALWRLGAYYLPTTLALWMAVMAIMSTCRLTGEEHEENLRLLSIAGTEPEATCD